ncbi:MAG: YfiR family protein [Bacteroidetes bacterium]|nr:YfiR family protein [Bacteroidota bacterium]
MVGDAGLWAQQPSSRESQVKAVFLFNFTQFIEWPAKTFPDAESPLIIGILGDDPFGNYLEQATTNEKINSHPLIIQHYKTVDEIKKCHILFVNISNKEQLDLVFKSLEGKSILTVGDSRNFIRQGGMIRFFTDNDKIKFQINVEVAKAAGLTISSKLLRLAEIVTSKNN